MPQEQARAIFNTILQVTCSFRQEMDNMATNQVFLPSQIVPNLWGSHRGLLEELSLLGPPSSSASWPASLVERSGSQRYLHARMCRVCPRLRPNPTFPLPEWQKQLQTLGRNHTNQPNKLPGYSEKMMQEEKKMRRHANWKRSGGRSPQGPYFL